MASMCDRLGSVEYENKNLLEVTYLDKVELLDIVSLRRCLLNGRGFIGYFSLTDY